MGSLPSHCNAAAGWAGDRAAGHGVTVPAPRQLPQRLWATSGADSGVAELDREQTGLRSGARTAVAVVLSHGAPIPQHARQQ